MSTKNIANSIKNAMGTIFLLAGAFFVCSTVLSIRAVFADPVTPIMDTVSSATSQSPRAGNTISRAPNRASPRNTVTKRTIARTATNVAPSRATANTVSRGTARNVTTRATTNRATTNTRTATRNVVSRTPATRAGATTTRNVRARTATNAAPTTSRVSLQGSAIRGSKGTTSSTYSYLSSKLYTGNYSNIIDSSTGLISNDAFNNCMESYYTCMDEICTARNAAQRRCACAGRVKAFAEAETALESANEELIKLSGELALLIASGGKDISSAFQLTDAEKVLNCVSWKDANKDGTWSTGTTDSDAYKWCTSHGIYTNAETCPMPSYCTESGNSFGFDISNIDSTNSSEILASFKAFADAKAETITILTKDDESLSEAFKVLDSTISSMTGISNAFASSDEIEDTLAETWGYDLFRYAHNEVCARVLDSCFNGIYEGCGTPPSGGKCADGRSTSCPFNYNSKIEVSSSGDIKLNDRSTSSLNTSATCYGYTSTSGDPYLNLRGPVADARRSIMNKYLLDANADCDVYGEQLRATAQNISYQKSAAQQALQQKRQEFAQTEQEETLTNAVTAYSNFNECLGEILECYEDVSESNENWPEARIKTYCAQVANVPHCYETMICNPSTAQFKAVIDVADNAQCKNSQDYTKNTCRNIVTLNEILKGTGASAPTTIPAEATGSSLAMREQCLLDAGIEDIRTWSPETINYFRCSLSEIRAIDKNAATGTKESQNATCEIQSCNSGYTLRDGRCVSNNIDCTSEIANAKSALRYVTNGQTGACTLVECETGYTKTGNTCIASTKQCSAQLLDALNATVGTQTWDNGAFGDCIVEACKETHELKDGKCVEKPTIKITYSFDRCADGWVDNFEPTKSIYVNTTLNLPDIKNVKIKSGATTVKWAKVDGDSADSSGIKCGTTQPLRADCTYKAADKDLTFRLSCQI